MIKLPTMGILPAPATAATLGIWLFQRHDWIEHGLEHALTASGNSRGWTLPEILTSAAAVPDLA